MWNRDRAISSTSWKENWSFGREIEFIGEVTTFAFKDRAERATE